MKLVCLKTGIGLVTLLGFISSGYAQHGHLNVGAAGKTQNAPLLWKNGDTFVDTSGYVKTLVFTNANVASNYFTGNITLTVLPATSAHAGPDPDAPALGAYIRYRLSVLEGPSGGEFGFWDVGATRPTVSLAAGQSATNLFLVSEGTGAAGSDPYGHIHGRRFTATKAGLYKVGFQAVDTSTNGTGGGPIHTPSPVLPVAFQAGVTLLSPALTGAVVNLTWGSLANYQATLEFRTNLVSTNWTIVGHRIGDDRFQTLPDTMGAGTKFYRLRLQPVEP